MADAYTAFQMIATISETQVHRVVCRVDGMSSVGVEWR